MRMTDPDPGSARPRALVVDDDPVVRLLSSRALEEIGFEVEEASNGEEALKRTEAAPPDFMLLDLEMPGIGGLETCQMVRELLPDLELPIVIATGMTDDETVSNAFRVGATDFVAKPVDWQLLQHRVRFVMRASGAIRHLQEARRAAETAARAKLDFLANMSHEIRTPMTAIAGFINALHGSDADALAESDREQAVETIQRNAGHLLRLIDDILELSRIDAGQLRIYVTRCDPASEAEEVVTALKPMALAKGIELHIEAAPRLSLTTDVTRMRQIMTNLIVNAIKFTDRGRVTVRIAPRADGAPGTAAFEVADTGIGMTEEQIDLAFRMFTQVDASMSRNQGGAGLGLAIVSRLVDALGGSIDVRSQPGIGSTFSVRLPSLPPSEERPGTSMRAQALPESHATPREIASAAGRILLVEDGADNSRLFGLILRRLGAEVALAENGRIAVDLALAAEAREPFDLILMDMQMPVLDGYSAVRELRQAGYSRPIVALTAHAMEGDRRRCLQVGCDDYATKPLSRAALADLVARWLPKR
jgi:signal transduction histidine kinase